MDWIQGGHSAHHHVLVSCTLCIQLTNTVIVSVPCVHWRLSLTISYLPMCLKRLTLIMTSSAKPKWGWPGQATSVDLTELKLRYPCKLYILDSNSPVSVFPGLSRPARPFYHLILFGLTGWLVPRPVHLERPWQTQLDESYQRRVELQDVLDEFRNS